MLPYIHLVKIALFMFVRFSFQIDSIVYGDLTVVTIEREPFVKVVNNEYEGFCVDLLKRIAFEVGFKYKWKLSDNGSYNGMIEDVAAGRADLAMADLTITSGRETIVDFSTPFMNVEISVLYVKRSSILYIFTLICVWIGFILILNIRKFKETTRILPSEQMEISCLTRILLLPYWWLFSLIVMIVLVLSLYFIIFTNQHLNYGSIKELSLHDNVKFGFVSGGSIASFIQNSHFQNYQNMVKDVNHSELITRVKKENGKFAALMESVTIEYLVLQDCDLIQVGSILKDFKGYGIAMRPRSGLRDRINQALLQLQEEGIIYQLKEKWWKKNDKDKVCPKIDQNEFLRSLVILDFVFVVLTVIIEVATMFFSHQNT